MGTHAVSLPPLVTTANTDDVRRPRRISISALDAGTGDCPASIVPTELRGRRNVWAVAPRAAQPPIALAEKLSVIEEAASPPTGARKGVDANDADDPEQRAVLVVELKAKCDQLAEGVALLHAQLAARSEAAAHAPRAAATLAEVRNEMAKLLHAERTALSSVAPASGALDILAKAAHAPRASDEFVATHPSSFDFHVVSSGALSTIIRCSRAMGKASPLEGPRRASIAVFGAPNGHVEIVRGGGNELVFRAARVRVFTDAIVPRITTRHAQVVAARSAAATPLRDPVQSLGADAAALRFVLALFTQPLRPLVVLKDPKEERTLQDGPLGGSLPALKPPRPPR